MSRIRNTDINSASCCYGHRYYISIVGLKLLYFKKLHLCYQTRIPGAQLAVMMLETFVPPSMLSWFGIVKNSVMDRWG